MHPFVDPGTPTPGPWRVLVLNWGYQILGPKSRVTRVIAAISGKTEDPRKDAQACADAHLMAATPLLLAACEALVATSDRFVAGDSNDYQDDLAAAIDQARAALAAAKGGS